MRNSDLFPRNRSEKQSFYLVHKTIFILDITISPRLRLGLLKVSDKNDSFCALDGKSTIIGSTRKGAMFLWQWIPFGMVLWLGVDAVNHTFPPDFIFGAGTSAYQIEGAVNSNGRSESIWDRYLNKNPSMVFDGASGKVACDSYHQWQQDVDAAAEMGLDFYRFSVSWARLLPTGLSSHINEDGKNYYNGLIDGLLEKGVKAMITIYHWDMPQRLQDLGGWANPLIVDWFAEYANVLFSLYGDRVTTWITINEPLAVCDMGYAKYFAPGLDDNDLGKYLCTKHVLLAHAKAWRIYHEVYRPKYHGQISLTNHILWAEPLSADEQDAADLAAEINIGRFSHPIYSKEGGWPQYIRNAIAKKSKEQGYPFSRLPEFTEEEVDLLRGTFDFYGLNYYTSRLARKRRPGDEDVKSLIDGDSDIDIMLEVNSTLKGTANWWFKQYPEGLRRSMQWIKDQYGDIKILITEVGFSTENDTVEDYDRVEFYRSYLEQVLLSIKEDNTKVMGFTAWSLLDNFEWLDGYRARFGLYAVDFQDPKRRRTPRLSAKYYATVISNRTLDIIPDYINK